MTHENTVRYFSSCCCYRRITPYALEGFTLVTTVNSEEATDNFFVACHTLAELYAVLTTLPLKPKISPLTARRLIHEDIEISARIVSLSSSDYRDTLKEMSELGLTGGMVYDALIAKAAKKSKVERLLTFNYDDFTRVWPDGESFIHTP